MPKKQKSPLKKAQKKADSKFSIYIRKRDNFICYTCGKKGTLKTTQCGHYEKRHHLNTRYDELNNHCQCSGCNLFQDGNYPAYSLRLVNDYGPEILKELDKRRRVSVKFSISDYEKIADIYEEKSKELDELKLLTDNL